MKYDKRTIEAFRRVNAEIRYKLQYAYPEFTTDALVAPYSLFVKKYPWGNRQRAYRVFHLGTYLTEELLRAGVETVAEFLEEVI